MNFFRIIYKNLGSRYLEIHIIEALCADSAEQSFLVMFKDFNPTIIIAEAL